MPYFRCSSVSVICKRFNYYCDTAWAISLVNDFFKISAVAFSGCFFKHSVNVIVWYIVLLCFCNNITKFGIIIRVRAPVFNCYCKFSSYFCENFCSCCVISTLFSFNGAPFVMTTHFLNSRM